MTYFLLPVLGKQVNRSSWNHWTVWLLDTKSCLWQRGLCELMPLLCDGQDLGQRIRVMGWPPGLKTEASCRSCTQWSRSDRLKSCVKKLLLIHWGQFNGIAGVPMQRPREKKHRVNSEKAEPDSVVLSNFLSFFSFMERGEEISGTERRWGMQQRAAGRTRTRASGLSLNGRRSTRWAGCPLARLFWHLRSLQTHESVTQTGLSFLNYFIATWSNTTPPMQLLEFLKCGGCFWSDCPLL